MWSLSFLLLFVVTKEDFGGCIFTDKIYKQQQLVDGEWLELAFASNMPALPNILPEC